MINLESVVLYAPVFSRSLEVLFLYVPLALLLLITVFYFNNLKRHFGDAKGMWVYFSLFFLFLCLIPVSIIIALEPQPLQLLSDLGVGLGNYKIGVLLILGWLPICGTTSFFASRNSAMKEWYPLSKEVCRKDGSFVLYELGYILLYYTAWEFLYRGVLFFPLLKALGVLPSITITAALSTLHHVGHPKTEILGALLGGFIFAFVALITGSLIYPIVFHALLGVGVDSFLYARNHRLRSVR